MTGSNAAAQADCSKAETRKQSQRERILAAAMCCFVKSGFHSASIATIAETAGMSPGLIYRYFDNKNAIILAIIRSQLEAAQHRIREMRNTDDLSANIIEYFEAREDFRETSMSAPLFLEMSAEGTRDPEIAEAIRCIDGAVRGELAEWFGRSRQQGGLGFPADEARERALAFVLLIDGIKARKVREPQLDRRCLKRAVDRIIATVVGDCEALPQSTIAARQ